MAGARLKWEQTDFPILCETCLGPNPYVRMLKDQFGRECKVCGRPYTVFKWSPGVGERWKKTEICQTCAKIKNACQTCILDLDFGIHVKERDEVLKIHNNIPMTNVNAHVYVRKMEEAFGDQAVVNTGKAMSAAKEVLKKLAKQQADPYTQKSKVVVCAFYKKGNCKRGQDCPFEHVMPLEKEKPTVNKQELKELKKMDLIPPTESVDSKYPSQNPNALGTASRSFNK